MTHIVNVPNQKVPREERLTVKLVVKAPNPHKQKSYVDDRRKYQVLIDSKEALEIKEESEIELNVKLRSLIVVKKMFGQKKVDSVMTWRVGENFSILKIGGTVLRIAMNFNDGNIFEILDSSSHIHKNRLLEIIKRDEE